MKIGFSLSPGGLLLPYHAGVLDSLEYNGALTQETHIAGASAGSIAAVAHSCGISGKRVLDATIQVSDACEALGGARGRLLPQLKDQMEHLIDEEALLKLQEREGVTGVAYREVFPQNRPILETNFTDRHHLIKSVCHSSMFPFFSTQWPAALDTSSTLPRIVVDGFFAVPRDRFGCPTFDMGDTKVEVDRTVTISVFPHAAIKLEASDEKDRISPSEEDSDIAQLLKLATQTSSAEALAKVYESGWEDAERWLRQEEDYLLN